ncbi:NAD(P)/FAD-dependent oxidoreductase [Gordonia sp. CPCC 205333]|uniref:NAD(P)/FAD-dependent oxidoreductase n=1 Tax=Gordonia sp. CPCC 205333 TaxID=3140790 RepID=UPI003AF39C66
MTTPATTSVVIVGTGIAGITTAEALRANGFDGAVTVIGDEPDLPYRRTALSKDIVSADLSPAKITLRKPEFWTERQIDIRTDSTVISIDTSGRTVTLADGSEITYTALVLATGAVSRRFDWLAPDVASLRTRADAIAVKSNLSQAKPLVIVGGGLIGLELAASAATSGTHVSVLEATDRPMGRVLPPVVSDLIATQHRSHGVDIHTNAVVTAAGINHVAAHGFDTPPDSFVVAALGSQPTTDLATSAGIPLGTSGIKVDANLRTNTAGVYAAGDVAEYPHPLTGLHHRSEHWLTAGDQGKVVAATVLADLGMGTQVSITPVPLAWTIQYGINIQIAGWPGDGDRITVDGSPEDFDATIRVFDGERLVGAVSVGRPASGRKTREEITSCLPPQQSAAVA